MRALKIFLTFSEGFYWGGWGGGGFEAHFIHFLTWGTHLYICHFVRPSVSRAPYLRNRTSCDHNFWYTCNMMISPGVFFLFSQKKFFLLLFCKKCNIVNIRLFCFFIGPLQQFLNVCFPSSSVTAKKKFWSVLHLHICEIFS